MNMMRMVIGETISEAQVKDFVNAFDSDMRKELAKEPGFLEVQVMTEDGGNMVVISTVWENREYCLRYHSSRSYRQFVAKTQHLLLGNFVVKLFQVQERAAAVMAI